MSLSTSKLIKPADQKPTELETQIAQVIVTEPQKKILPKDWKFTTDYY